MIAIPEGPLLAFVFLMVLTIICIINFEVNAEPVVNDPSLEVEPLITGIKFPSSMAFLGPDDILVLEKNQGTVRRIVNGNMLNESLLDVNVANKKETGMLGIAISKQESKDGDKSKVYVFLYYTETKSKDGEDLEEGGVVLGNRLYRYELENNKLVNPKLLLDLPADHPEHLGGVVLIGPDNNAYLVTGEITYRNKAQNVIDGKEPDGSSAILRITQDGKAVGKGILGNRSPLNLYYAYGIRNSFGMDFDPVTGNLWDTENGLDCCDEINLVKPGFNSGWEKVQGIWKLNQSKQKVGIFNETSSQELITWNSTKGPEVLKLVDFDGKGKYSSPEFTWDYTVGPSALKFLDSDKLGKQYENDMFVGDVNHQQFYHFDLTEDRKELLLNGKMIDKVSDDRGELQGIVFGDGFDRVTDIEVGPDGNLYILSHSWNDDPLLRMGSIFKISKK